MNILHPNKDGGFENTDVVNPSVKDDNNALVTSERSAYANNKLETCIDEQDENSIIDLARRSLNDKDMDLIAKYAIKKKRCRGLFIWKNEFSHIGIQTLANALSNNDTLKELDLSHNSIDDKSVEILSKTLENGDSILDELDLSYNQITDQGAEYLANALNKNKILKMLILNNNHITKDGLMSLVRGIAQNEHTKLIKLKLERNEKLKVDENILKSIIDHLKDNEVLQEIYLRECNIDAETKKLEHLAFQTGFDIILQ